MKQNNLDLEDEQQDNQNNQDIKIKDNESFLIIGQATFSIQCQEDLAKLKTLIKKVVKTMLIRSDIWKLGSLQNYSDNGKYIRMKWNQIYQKIIQSNTKKITLFRNFHPFILKQISSCSFQQLQMINLNYNNINNIEAIGFLNCPRLQILWLNYNKISNLKSFSKWKHKHLDEIMLDYNPVKSIDNFYRGKFYESIKRLWIYFSSVKENNQIDNTFPFFNISPIFKLQQEDCQQIWLNKMAKCSSFQKLIIMIKNKYPMTVIKPLH